MNIAPSTVSHHIKELRQAGIIVVERRGKNIECWVNEEAVLGLRELLHSGSVLMPGESACGKPDRDALR